MTRRFSCRIAERAERDTPLHLHRSMFDRIATQTALVAHEAKVMAEAAKEGKALSDAKSIAAVKGLEAMTAGVDTFMLRLECE